jgi:hypothetical protein
LEILFPSISLQPQSWIDPDADRFFPPDSKVTEAPVMRLSNALKRIGIRGLSWQGLLPIYRVGSKMLSREKFDLVFFSTTAFNFFCLGRLWKRRFGVPYVLDLQDPWFREMPAKIATTKHVFKTKIGNALSRHMERFAIETADGIISVSPNYLLTMRERYPEARAIRTGRIATIPFGAFEQDFGALPKSDLRPAPLTIAYVGAGGFLMAKSFGYFVRSLGRVRAKHPDLVGLFRIHLVGTDGEWAEGGAKVLQNIASISGVGDLVIEDPAIVPYSRSVEIAKAASGLLVLGVDEDAYMASKLFPYASLRKPLLACICKDSQMNAYFEARSDLGTVIHFGDTSGNPADDEMVLKFLEQLRAGSKAPRANIMDEYSAMAMTSKIAQLFDNCVGS